MDRLIMLLATGFGLGKMPLAPGTWGTLLAFPIHLAISRLAVPGQVAGIVTLAVLAVAVSGSAEKILDRRDPGQVVIDEVAGMLVGLIGVTPAPVPWIVAFLLFRFFDIAKPFPIRTVDQRLHGGMGIVADDLLAGLYTLGAIQLLGFLFPEFF